VDEIIEAASNKRTDQRKLAEALRLHHHGSSLPLGTMHLPEVPGSML